MPSYKGECFCGAVQIREAGGERLLPLPILPFLVSRARQCLHALEARTAGAEHIATFPKTACSQRQYCKNCGGHLMTNHPPRPRCRRCHISPASISTMLRRSCPCGTAFQN